MRRCCKYVLFLFVLLLSVVNSSKGQTTQFHFNRIDVRNGISHNQVNSIYKDDKGFIWFGTMSGLNRYDGYSFKIFKNDPKDSTTISDNYVEKITSLPGRKMFVSTRNGFNIYDPVTQKFDRNFEQFSQSLHLPDSPLLDIQVDKNGNYYFLYPSAGLFRYNPRLKKTELCIKSKDGNITAFGIDQQANLWISMDDGSLEKYDGQNQRVIHSQVLAKELAGTSDQVFISVDSDEDVWIRRKNSPSGVYLFTKSKDIIRFHTGAGTPFRLSSDIITGITEGKKGEIWISTDHGGLNLFNKKSATIKHLIGDPYDEKSISQNSVNTLFKDNFGILWLGTYKRGVSYYDESIVKFPLIEYKPTNTKGLSHGDVNRFVEDDKGNIWIGTNGGGLIYYDRKHHLFTTYRHDPSNPNSLSNDVVVSLLIAKNKDLWIGTYFGGISRFDGKSFTRYRHDPKDTNSLADDRIWELMQDSRGHIWVGLFDKGIDRFDPETNRFVHTASLFPHTQLSSPYITSLIEDGKKNIWIGTAYGLNKYDPLSGKNIIYKNNINDPNSLSKNNILSVREDRRGLIWIATREGLNVLDPEKNIFRRFSMREGLPDNTVTDVVEVADDQLWLGTPSGLSKITVSPGQQLKNLTFLFENFNERNNLQAREFNKNASLKLNSGELIFGGPNGFNIFYPQQILQDKLPSNLVISDIQVFNQSVIPGQEINGRVILDVAITETDQINLRHQENVFSLEFALLNYSQNTKQQYAYMLEGFDKDWTMTDGNHRRATYTNLNPGTYTFKVKAADNRGKYGLPATLRIIVTPPFWLTPTAFVLYFLLILGTLYLARRITLERARLRFNVGEQQREAARMHEMDMMKIRFFTNVSHEFRTPISLIMAPADKMLRHTADEGQKQNLQLIRRNARRLLNMVNQLLDFRKLEEQELSLSLSGGDIVKFIRETSLSFVDLAENKQIEFSVESNVAHFNTAFDRAKLERIIFNLISNAFKFTPEYGRIHVSANIIEQQVRYLELTVADSGIGIEKEKQEKIFDQFFQTATPNFISSHGTGIGLAITKEFVQLHKGSISVESEINKGSIFKVVLPVEELPELVYEPPVAEPDLIQTDLKEGPVSKGSVPSKKERTILIVEDNEDFRFYLKDNLKAYFSIIEAPNGKIGWQKALSHHPDFIVSDVNMPEMNGIDLCKRLKGDPRTSFIPVVLLTALTGEEYHLESLNTGADDYMAKPFNFEILFSRISNILSQQDKLRKTYKRQVQVQPQEQEAGGAQNEDDMFIRTAFGLVENNISNLEFSVEEMSQALHLSRAGLYKKIFALTGKTPLEFVREIRLQKAAHLLQSSNLNISEIAYEVGFNPKSFTKNFKAVYHMLPSEYQDQQRAKV